MGRSAYICCILLVLQHSVPGNCFEPVSGFTAGLAAIGSFIYLGYEAINCRFRSCCNNKWIIDDLKRLENDLAQKLHGQHLVQKAVLNHIKGHLRSADPPKALALSFHGLTGVGKNFVSRIIAESLYKDGLHSKYVHLVAATKEFPHEEMVPFYKSQLQSWIEGNVTLCERSLFIFDEVDKLPPLLLDTIKPYLDYYTHLGGINYRKTIFLFLSNTGGSSIGQALFDHWKSGKKRESLQLSNVENMIMNSAINDNSQHGLWHSQLISKHLITAYIPFLPLEKIHVKKCIRDALVAKRYIIHPDHAADDIVDEVIKELTFYPPAEQWFSSTGCKRASEKVDFVMLDRSSLNPKSRSEL